MVEMLLVLGALAVLFGAIYSGFERLSRSYTAENVKAGTQQSARIGVETMVQDMRLTGLNPLGTGRRRGRGGHPHELPIYGRRQL